MTLLGPLQWLFELFFPLLPGHPFFIQKSKWYFTPLFKSSENFQLTLEYNPNSCWFWLLPSLKESAHCALVLLSLQLLLYCAKFFSTLQPSLPRSKAAAEFLPSISFVFVFMEIAILKIRMPADRQ